MLYMGGYKLQGFEPLPGRLGAQQCWASTSKTADTVILLANAEQYPITALSVIPTASCKASLQIALSRLGA